MYLFVLSADISSADSSLNAPRIASEDGDASTSPFKMPALYKMDITIQMEIWRKKLTSWCAGKQRNRIWARVWPWVSLAMLVTFCKSSCLPPDWKQDQCCRVNIGSWVLLFFSQLEHWPYGRDILGAVMHTTVSVRQSNLCLSCYVFFLTIGVVSRDWSSTSDLYLFCFQDSRLSLVSPAGRVIFVVCESSIIQSWISQVFGYDFIHRFLMAVPSLRVLRYRPSLK